MSLDHIGGSGLTRVKSESLFILYTLPKNKPKSF